MRSVGATETLLDIALVEAPDASIDAAEFEHEPQDECGVFGVWAPGEPVLQLTIAGMEGLQNRGHSGAGIAYELGNVTTLDGGPQPIIIHKGPGKVGKAIREIYQPDNPEWKFNLPAFEKIIQSRAAIGHTRYSTDESERFDALHPHSLLTGAMAHNGELSNVLDLMWEYGMDPEDAPSDSGGLALLLNARTEVHGDLLPALREILPKVEGAYCLTMIDKGRLIAARDPWGYHPLALGKLPDGRGYVVASEQVVFESMGAEFVRDIERGEIVVIDENGIQSSKMDRQEKEQLCSFEGIYTAREEGVIQGISVREWRKNLGRFLAKDHPAPDADCVVGVPATGLASARGFAEVSRLPLVEAIEKRVGSSRTFQMRGDKRADEIERKYIFHRELIEGRKLVVDDDSTIKGWTHRAIIKKLRELGAAEVHLRLSSWPYLRPCFMGMDTHLLKNLVAGRMSMEELAEYLGADSIGFNTPERVQEAADRAHVTGRAARLCISCFTGEYATKPPRGVMLGMPVVRESVDFAATR